MLRTIDNGGDTKNAKTARGITAGMRYLSYSQAERDLINEAVKDYAKYAEHIYIHEGVGDIGAAQIRQAVETHIQITGAKPVVVVDYLQILAPYDVRATDKQNTDKAVLELKRLSRDYKLPVIGISSFNRENYDTGASMKAFKESGSIEYSCDVLFGLQLEGMDEKGFDVNAAKQNDPRRIELVVLKNRNGATGGKVRFSYYPRFNLYMEA
jgi:replicative DNA helicase